jgi:hypothetical protein
MQKTKSVETHFVECIRDLLKFKPEAGLAGVTKNSRQLFDFTITSMKSLHIKTERAHQAVFGKQADDFTSLLKLQRQMVEMSHTFA